MATTPAPVGRGARGQFFPDAQGHYHTGSHFIDLQYENDDALDKVMQTDPRVQALIQSGGSGHVDKVRGDTDVTIVNGKVTGTTTGGIWKPLLAAAAVAGGGVAASYLAPAAGGTGAGTTGAGAAEAGGTEAGTGAATVGTGTAEAGGFDAAGNFVGDTTYGVGGTTGATGIQKYLDAAGDISNALSGQEAGRQAGRNTENANNYNYDRAQQDQYRTQVQANQNENQFGVQLANATNAQRQFQLDAPGKRAGNAVRGDILSNAHDVSIAGLPSGITVPQINGGLRPSMFTDNTRALGTDMTQQAHDQQLAHTDAYALPTYKPPPAAPGVTPPVQANGVDTALTTGGTVLGYAQMLAKLYNGGR